jgi:bifunctional DNA-binding transcriptional regulator/antitoxin component of YhaV-PrlF toxin-antitoxin module
MTMLIQADSRRRITLPPSTDLKPGDYMEVEVLEDGRILLAPVATIPRHQIWAWTAETKKTVVESLSDPRPSTEISSKREAVETAKRWIGED